MLYFDQAATSYPKPREVIDTMITTMNDIGANPGRSGHRLEREAAKLVNQTREQVARLFGCSNPKQCLFFQNASIALNQAIKGISWQKDDHIIVSSLEHNSVRRPLEYIKRMYGVRVTYVSWTKDQKQFLSSLQQSIEKETRALIVTHASNVTGTVLPLKQMMKIAKEKELITIVDSSQTAGHLPIHMKEDQIDLLAFPSHKGLLGPQGVGVLLIEGDIDLFPIHHGGTGVYSEEVEQPDISPFKFESGTLNTPGISGFSAALKLYEREQHENVSRETFLTKKIVSELKQIDGVEVYSPSGKDLQLPIVAFNLIDIPSQEVAAILDSHYDMAVRAGLHCNPLSHETYNTLEQGMIRASLSKFNTEQEVIQFIQAIKEIVEGYQI